MKPIEFAMIDLKDEELISLWNKKRKIINRSNGANLHNIKLITQIEYEYLQGILELQEKLIQKYENQIDCDNKKPLEYHDFDEAQEEIVKELNINSDNFQDLYYT